MSKAVIIKRSLLIVWIAILGISALLHYRHYAAYGYTLNAVTGLAGLTFVGIVLTATYLVYDGFLWLVRTKGKLRSNLRLLGGSLLASIALVEIILRIMGMNAAFGENGIFGNYYTFYLVDKADWFHTWPPNQEHDFHAPGEFHYTRTSNEMGLSEVSIPKEKPAGEYRIIGLGDSFTEGVGAPYDSTWVNQLESYLQDELKDSFPDKVVKCYNAGVAGSDPVYGYILMKEKLLELQPDLVIQCVNFTDEGDIFTKGGISRFNEDGTTSFLPGPKWEPIYALSYIYRLYIRNVKGYEDILIDPADRPTLEEQATKEITQTLTAHQDLADENGYEFLAVIHPMWNEVSDTAYEGNLGNLILETERAEPRPFRYLDLMNHYVYDVGMGYDNIYNYYWPEYHHNAMGYKMMAEGIGEEILKDVSEK